MVAVIMLALSAPVMADTAGGFLGALLGAAVGSQVGDGNGKKFATIVGALAGASIGSRLEDGTYGKDAQGEYVCTNCNGTTYAQQQQQQQFADNPAVAAAAHRGAAQANERAQCEMEGRAYYSNGGTGQYICSNGYNRNGYHSGGHNYAGNYNNRGSNVQWR